MPPRSLASFDVANDLLASPERLKARLADHGYLYFRGVLDRDAVLTVKRDLASVLAGQGIVRPGAAEPIWTGVGLDRIDDVALYALSSYQELSEGGARRLAEKVFGEP